jgi:hypothetical protein
LKITRHRISKPISTQSRSVQRPPVGPARLLSRLCLICLAPQQPRIPHLSLRQTHTQSARENIVGDRCGDRVRLRETFPSLDAHDSSGPCWMGRFVGLTEHREPFSDCGTGQFVEGGWSALRLEPAGEERDSLPVQAQGCWGASFGSEVSEKRSLRILQAGGHGC